MTDMKPLPNDAQVHVDGLGLNDRIRIYADERDAEHGGNASHCYDIMMATTPHGSLDPDDCWTVGTMGFQHGPRDEPGSTPGITDAVLVAILLDRYRGFQAGPFACRENALVITKLEEALLWMQKRAMTRHRQGVLGKNQQHAEPE